jgi:hypothetical protein
MKMPPFIWRRIGLRDRVPTQASHVESDFALGVGPIGLHTGCDQRDAEAAALSTQAKARPNVVDKLIWLNPAHVERVLVQELSGTIVINSGYYLYT